MNITFVSNFVDTEKFFDLFKKSKIPGQQVQKFNGLIINGLSKQDNCTIRCVSALPITRINTDKLFVKSEKIKKKQVYYNYLSAINIPLLKNINDVIGGFLNIIKLKDRNKNVIVCDVLQLSVVIGALFACKLRGLKAVGIVTDLPEFLANPTGWRLWLYNSVINAFDAYQFMTEDMNHKVNNKQKPYIVIEGLVDTEMSKESNSIQSKSNKLICMYAGALKDSYGLDILVEGFLDAGVENSELHIYGDGDYGKQLEAIAKEHKNVKYFGTKPNKEVVKAQLKATLLVNPRYTNEEYTKYSFPSKNMEYMASGTATLTTKLKGMPKQYYDYIYTIDKETPLGISDSIKTILSRDIREIHHKGMSAQDFVLKYKNSNAQAAKLIKLIESTLDYEC
ncbi:glycosyltransferase [Vibrio breoganii]